jgi:hypothetical protein
MNIQKPVLTRTGSKLLASPALDGSWSWMNMTRIIGGDASIQRIVSQSSTIGVLSALVCAFAFSGFQAAPDSVINNDAYGILMSLSVVFNLSSILLSSHVIIHLNTINWNTESVISGMSKNNSHLIVSIAMDAMFLAGLISFMLAYFIMTYEMYSTLVFYFTIISGIIVLLITFIFIGAFADAMIKAYNEQNKNELNNETELKEVVIQ